MTLKVMPLETLWEIAGELRAIHDRIQARGGLITPEDDADLEATGWKFEEKVRRCGLYRRSLEHHQLVLKHEQDALKQRAQSIEGEHGWITKYMLRQFAFAEVDRVPDEGREWRVKETRGKTVVDDPALLPDSLVTVKRIPDLTEVRKQLDRGVPLAARVEKETRLYLE